MARAPGFPVATPTPARSLIPADSYPPAEESFARLHRAGWSVGNARLLTAEGPRWWVSGSNGENRIESRALSQAEAWYRACEQAEAAGMLGRGR